LLRMQLGYKYAAKQYHQCPKLNHNHKIKKNGDINASVFFISSEIA
jgi:hypothetical protein